MCIQYVCVMFRSWEIWSGITGRRTNEQASFRWLVVLFFFSFYVSMLSIYIPYCSRFANVLARTFIAYYIVVIHTLACYFSIFSTNLVRCTFFRIISYM